MGLYINKIPEILIIVALSLKITESNSKTTTETFTNSTGNYTNDVHNNEEYEYSEFAQNVEKIEILGWKILAPTFLVIGVVGNTLSILVLRR